MTVQKLTCPTCGRATPVSQAAHLPFCSERCRLIDLGRWLVEDHALLVQADDEPESKPGQTSDPYGSDPYGAERPPVRLPPGWHDA